MRRNGFLEETYHTWSFVPFRDREGTVIGYEVSSRLEYDARALD
jgi:hypothetical protein